MKETENLTDWTREGKRQKKGLEVARSSTQSTSADFSIALRKAEEQWDGSTRQETRQGFTRIRTPPSISYSYKSLCASFQGTQSNGNSPERKFMLNVYKTTRNYRLTFSKIILAISLDFRHRHISYLFIYVANNYAQFLTSFLKDTMSSFAAATLCKESWSPLWGMSHQLFQANFTGNLSSQIIKLICCAGHLCMILQWLFFFWNNSSLWFCALVETIAVSSWTCR